MISRYRGGRLLISGVPHVHTSLALSPSLMLPIASPVPCTSSHRLQTSKPVTSINQGLRNVCVLGCSRTLAARRRHTCYASHGRVIGMLSNKARKPVIENNIPLIQCQRHINSTPWPTCLALRNKSDNFSWFYNRYTMRRMPRMRIDCWVIHCDLRRQSLCDGSSYCKLTLRLANSPHKVPWVLSWSKSCAANFNSPSEKSKKQYA